MKNKIREKKLQDNREEGIIEKKIKKGSMERIKCVLDETKDCDNCMECEICDLDPNKICDNCGKCLNIQDYATIKIEKVYTDPKQYHEN